MRNEIYARHGRHFVTDWIRQRFESQSWYQENPRYSDALLSDVENYNAKFILDYQNQYGLRMR
jgi:hypothetical protein